MAAPYPTEPYLADPSVNEYGHDVPQTRTVNTESLPKIPNKKKFV